MKLRLQSLLAILLFMAGVLLQLLLSSGAVWAELEASMYGRRAAEGGLPLDCPLVLSPLESRTISVAINNSSDQPVTPMITTEISAPDGVKSQSQTLPLAAHETKFLQWRVNNSNVIFGRLILANINQGRDAELASRSGFCGILVFKLFNLTGGQSLMLFGIGSLFLILAGGILWRRIHAAGEASMDQTFKACGGLAGVSTLAFLAALPRWWGLTLFLDAFALIMLSVIFTEFLLFPKSNIS